MLDLRRSIERVGGNHRTARLKDAVIHHHELRRVRHEDSHAVTLLHAHVYQRGGDTVGDRIHLLVSDNRALEDRAGAVRILARGFLEKMEQRRFGIFDCVWHPFVVVLLP